MHPDPPCASPDQHLQLLGREHYSQWQTPVVPAQHGSNFDDDQRSTHGRNGKADVVPLRLDTAVVAKSEADGGSKSSNAGPSAGGDDAIGAMVVSGDSIQWRELSRHVPVRRGRLRGEIKSSGTKATKHIS